MTGFSLVPANMQEAFKLAEMMAASELVPKDYRGKPGNVLIAVQMGAELGLSPMASIQNISVINGRPGLWGDAGKALLLAAGFQIEEDDIEVIRKNGKACCRITRPGGSQVVERTFSLEDAKQANLLSKDGPWRQYRERQMAWRAFWFAARDAAADVLKGLGGKEELVDLPPEVDVTTTSEFKVERIKSILGTSDKQEEVLALPIIAVDEVLLEINRAQNADDLAAVAEKAAGIQNDDDRKIARAAWSKRRREIEAALNGPTIADALTLVKEGQFDAARDLVKGAGFTDLDRAAVESEIQTQATPQQDKDHTLEQLIVE